MATNLSGSTTAVFIVTLSAALEKAVTVGWVTADGTGKAGVDYEAASGSVTFEPGETAKQIQVVVYGREEGATSESRTFKILLTPPENAILDQELTEVIISVTDDEGAPVTSVTVATGPRGVKGDPGLSAYQLAVMQGEFVGTLDEWLQFERDAKVNADKAEAAANSVDDKISEATASAIAEASTQADRSTQQAVRSEAAADRAETAYVVGMPYKDVPTAQAAIDGGNIPVGNFFNVRSQSLLDYVDEYQNVAGVATPTGKSYPARKAIEEVLSTVRKDGSEEVVAKILNSFGFMIWKLLGNGSFGTKNTLITPDSVLLQHLQIKKTDLGALVLKDKAGFYKIIVDNNGNIPGASSGGGDAGLAARNASNLAYSANVKGQYNSAIQRPVANLNHCQWYGQSLGSDQECWPALSKVAKALLDNLMLGDSPRPNARGGAAFVPVGSATLKPLKAVVQDPSNPNIINTDAQVAALPPGAANEGEGAVAAVNFFREMWLQHHGLMQDANRRLVLSNGAVNGKTIEALSKGADPELYQRPLQAAQQVKAIADSQGLSYAVYALCWLQGEWNYTTAYGGDTTKEGYKAKLKQLYQDFVQDHCYAIAGQSKPCAIFTYQTSASFTNDTNDLAIGMAQWEFSKEEKNAYLVTPSYPAWDKGGHLNPNGSRWMDMQFGKVKHRVLTLGEGWEPLSPIGNTLKGRELLVDYHVPCPPLQFKAVAVGTTDTTYTQKGFRVQDDSGTVPIVSVEIATDTIIRITLGRDVVGSAKLFYADKTVHNGNGNVCDSDPFIAGDNYVYQAGSGQYAGENKPELIDKPYSLENWSIAFCVPVNIIS